MAAGSRNLAALGAEVVECNSFNPDDLLQAFQGAQAVFGQTPHAVPGDVELRAAKAQAVAAEAVGVKSFIFSSLENVERRSQVISLVSLMSLEGSWSNAIPSDQ